MERVVIRHIRLRLRTPFVTALGAEDQRDIIIVEVHGEGHIGYGEVPVMAKPVYNEETVVTAWHVLNDFFVAAVLEGRVAHPFDAARLLSVYHGHAMAKAGLEGAVWDLWARRRGQPLSRALGGFQRRGPGRGAVGLAGATDGPPRRAAAYLRP